MKKIIIAVGGTGGHLFPAQAFAREMQLRYNGKIDILFVGGGLSQSRYFDREAFAYKEVASGTFWNHSPLKLVSSATKISWGILQSWRILKNYAPDLLVGFGSHYSFPALAAAWLSRVPIVLHEQNSIPGKVNRLFARKALFSGVVFPKAAEWMGGKALHVNMPLRDGYRQPALTLEEARSYFQLAPDLFTLLVFGGSQGAKTINESFINAAQLLSQASLRFQVLHFTGETDSLEKYRRLYRTWGVTACVKAFEPEMAKAWRASNLAISRAGALSLAEQVEMEVPSILIPWPRSADGHQDKNAAYVSEVVKGALILKEEEASPRTLAHLISQLTAQRGEKLQRMKQALQEHKRLSKQQDFCFLVSQQVGLER